MKKLTFTITNGALIDPVVFGEEVFTIGVIKIGKLPSCQLRLTHDEKVNRCHAVIENSPNGEVSIIDLGSTSGTEVIGSDGYRYRMNKAKLHDGDTIVMGDTHLKLKIEDA